LRFYAGKVRVCGKFVMPGRNKLEPISEPEFDDLLKALSGTTKGRSFLEEYRRRFQPTETLKLLNSLSKIESTIGTVREELQPDRIANELQHISMTLDIAVDGAQVDPHGSETARRFALVERARRDLVMLARSLAEIAAPASGAGQGDADAPPEER
jgi:hypothetical protein